MSLWAVFLTGLTTGGLTCLAVQGGLLASLLAIREKEHPDNKLPLLQTSTVLVLLFVGAKLLVHTVLGFLLGALGSVVSVNVTVTAFIQLAIGIFMLGTAGRLLNLHPVFNYFSITPPTSVLKLIKSNQKNKSLLAPMILGALTVFIPCGTTQAMEAYAIASQSPFLGALIMFLFVLGTIPLFVLIGVLALKAGDLAKQTFLRVSAAVIIVLGVIAVDSSLGLFGFPYSLADIGGVFQKDASEQAVVRGTELQEINVQANSQGYYPSTIRVKKGIPVKINFLSYDNYSCSRGLVIPSLKYKKILPVNGEESVEFLPERSGEVIAFSCSMGMYRGKIIVE